MSKNSSTSSFDQTQFLVRTGVFVSVILLINVVLLAGVFYTHHEDKGPQEPVQAAISVFGGSNVGYDIDPDRLDHAQLLSTAEPYGFFLSFERCRQRCVGKTLLLDMPYSWYAPERYAPATYPFYTQITPSLYGRLIQAKPVLALKNFLCTNPLNSQLLLYWRNTIMAKAEAAGAATPAPSESTVHDTYHTCNSRYDASKHFISQMGYDPAHFLYIKNEVMRYAGDKGIKVLAKYPELNRNNYHINQQMVEAIQANFETVNRLEDWPDSLMYDQWYHLNQCGRDANTSRVADTLLAKGLLKL